MAVSVPSDPLKVINPLLRRILLSRWGERIGSLMVLRFAGRRSGHIVEVPVSYPNIHGVITVVTDRPWRLNFAGNAPVMVVHRGRQRRGRGHLLDASPEEVGAAIRAALDTGDSPRSFGLAVARGHDPTVAELTALGQTMIRVDLEVDHRAGSAPEGG